MANRGAEPIFSSHVEKRFVSRGSGRQRRGWWWCGVWVCTYVCVCVSVCGGVLSANALLILHCSSDFTVVQQKKGFGQQSCSSNLFNFYWKASMQAVCSNVTKLCRQCRAPIREPSSKQPLTCWKQYANQQPWKQPNRLNRVTIQCSLCGVKAEIGKPFIYVKWGEKHEAL